MSRFVASLAVGVCAALLVGCGDKATTPTGERAPPPGEFKPKKDEHGHEHKGGEKDVTIDGKIRHVFLSAHFSADHGNELEVNFETADKEPKPVTLPEKAKLTATVKQGEMLHTIEFEPGDKEERKTDPPGQCSRFAAKAPWMKSNDKLTVTLTIEGVAQKIPWIDFEPGKNAHKD